MTAPAVATLAEHAAAIRQLGKQTVENVVEIGRRLVQCKELVGHGNWLPWLDREFGWDERTARNFMRAHELATKSEKFSDLNLPLSALYMLAAPSTPPEARDEVLARAEAGEKGTVAEVKTAIAKPKPEEPKSKFKPKRPHANVNPACFVFFDNEDQLDAFAHVVDLPTVRRFVTREQQVDLAKQLTEGNIRAVHYQSWVGDWL